MRRADRLFQIIQVLRRSTRPVTAAALAEELEVSTRTVYRDVADLIGQRVPIEGEAGLGYLIASDYDMPPLMLTPDEIEAVMLGAQWVAGRSDKALGNAARDVMAKIAAVVPERLRPFIVEPSVGVKPMLAEPKESHRSVQSTIGDPQRSKTAAALPVRGRRGNRTKSVAGDPRLRRDHAPAGRLVRAASGLPAFSHRPDHRGGDARRKHRVAPWRIAPPLAALARDERALRAWRVRAQPRGRRRRRG